MYGTPAEARVDIRIPVELKEALRLAASVRRVSMSEALRQAVEAFVAATVAATNEAAPAMGRPQTHRDRSSADHQPDREATCAPG